MSDINLNSAGPALGFHREGTIRGFNANRGTVIVSLNLSKSISGTDKRNIEMPMPASWLGPNGEFSGGYPILGASVWAVMGSGGQWTISSYGVSNDVFSAGGGNFNAAGNRRNVMSSLRPGRWLTQVQNNIKIIADPIIGIQTGDSNEYQQADPKRKILSNTFSSNMAFTEAGRSVSGPVYRDKRANSGRNISGSSLSAHSYQDSLSKIGLDPLTRTGNSFVRNPAFVENRDVVYEFEQSFEFTNDKKEISLYDLDESATVSSALKREQTRADTLSLSLEYPNHLIESVSGTLVDIYGNILDINRSKLPNGVVDSLSFRLNEENKSQTFIDLREQTRKSVAFHWELNARKNLPQNIPDVLKTNDYARDRSRFFVDIDKEGQFKINIPASSETGNVSLPVRYENYSTIKAAENNNETDPRDFLRNGADDTDIYVDNYGVGSISLEGGIDDLKGFAAPIDRITEEPIKLGTSFHDINGGLLLHKRENPISGYSDSLINSLDLIEKIVEDTIIVSGPDANAGGRSGTIALDGQLSLSIGANTVDRQSLWLDTAGGIVANVGRDKRNVSAAFTLDGDLLIQVGGATVADDSRFNTLNNAVRDGIIDIRVVNNAQMTVVRIDGSGVTVHTPGRLDLVSEGDLRLKSVRGNVHLDGENIFMYSNDNGNGRLVTRKPGRTI